MPELVTKTISQSRSSLSVRTGKIEFVPDEEVEIQVLVDTLDDIKGKKLKELSDDCDTEIVGKFKSAVNGVDYFFSYDTEAQSNFTKAGRAFDKGKITSIPWTAYDTNGNMVRLTLSADQFEQVDTDSLIHLNGCIGKLRDTLQPKVESAQSEEEINKITWQGVTE